MLQKVTDWKAIFGLAISVNLTSAAAEAGTCSSYVGHSVQAQSAAAVISKLPKIPPKSEFETEAAFKSRTSDAIPDTTYILLKANADGLTYDADKGGFTFSERILGREIGGFLAATAISDADLGVDAMLPFVGGATFVASRTTLATGSFIGTNSFGVKTRVSRQTEIVLAVHSFEDTISPSGGVIPVDIQDAQRYRDRLRLAYVFRPQFPFVVRGSIVYEATLDDPREVTERFTILSGTLDCALLIDSVSGRVFGTS